MSDTRGVQSLGEAFPIELDRAREMLTAYRELPGGVGAFGAIFIDDTIKRAERALAGGDVVEMLRLFTELQEIE